MKSNAPFPFQFARAVSRRLARFCAMIAAVAACAVMLSAPTEQAQAQAACPANSFRANSGNCECYPNWGGGAHNTAGAPNACQCRTFESYYQLPGAATPECVPNGFLDRFKSAMEQCDSRGWNVRRDSNQIYHCQVRNLANQNAFAASNECALNAPPDSYYPCHAIFGNPPVFPFTEILRSEGTTFNYCPSGTLPVSHDNRSTCIPADAANYFRICAARGWTPYGPTAAGQNTYGCNIPFRDGATNNDYNRCRIAGPPGGIWCRDVFGEPYFPQKPDEGSPRYYYNCPNGELEDRSGCANLCGNGIRLAPDETGLNRCAPCLSGVAQDGECAPCPAGTAATSNRSECIVCPAGMTPATDGEQCVACPAGTFSTSDNLECRACPQGTIPNDGRTGCLNPSAIECPAGQAPNNANTACATITCPTGQQLNSAQTDCECPSGTVSTPDNSECVSETVAAYRALCEAAGWTAQNRGRALGELYSGERYEVCHIRSRDGAANFTRQYCVMHAANARGGAIDEYFEPQWGTNSHTRRDIRCEEVFPNWKTDGFPSRVGGFSAFLYNCPDGKQPSARNGAPANCTCAGVTTGQCGAEIRECKRRAAAAGVSETSAFASGFNSQLLCQNYANNTHIPGLENDFTPLGSCVIGENCQAAFDATPFPCLTGYANEDNSACESCPTNWRRKFDDDNDRWICERSKVDREESGPLRKGQTSSNDGICTIAGWGAEDLDTTVGRIWGCRIPLWEMDQAKFLQGELAGTQYDGCVVHDQPLWQSCGGRTRTHNGRTYLCDCDDAEDATGDWRTHGLPIDLDGPGGAQLPLLFTFNCPGSLEPADYTGREHQKICACPREGSSVESGECESERDDCRDLGGRIVPGAHLQEYCEGYHADGTGRCVIGWGTDAPNSCKTLLPPVCEAGYVLNRGETECVLQQHIAECDARGGRVEGGECVGFQLDGEGRCFVERGGKNPANCQIAFEDTPQKECSDDHRVNPDTLKCEQCPAGFTNSDDYRFCVLREPTGDDYTGTKNESSSCVVVWYPDEQVTRYECKSGLPGDKEGEARAVCELAGWTFQLLSDGHATLEHWRCVSHKIFNAQTGDNVRYCVLGPDSYISGHLRESGQTTCASLYPNWKTQGLPRRADTGPDRVFGSDDDVLAHTTFNCPAGREVADPLGRYLPGYCVCPPNAASNSKCAEHRGECFSRQGRIAYDESNHLEEVCVGYETNGGGECIIGATDDEYRYASDANRHEDARNAETCEDAFARDPPPCPPDQYAATNSARECASTNAQGVCTTYETVAVHSCETCPDGQIPNHDRDGCVTDDIEAHIAECEYRTGVSRQNFRSDFRGERLGGALAAEDLLCENYAGESAGLCRLGPSDSPDSCHAAFRSQGVRRPCPVGSASFGWNVCRQCLEGYVNNPDGDRCVLEGALAAQTTQCEDERSARTFTRQRTAANGREVTDHYCADFLPAGGGECRMGDTDYERAGTCAKFFREYAPACRVGFHWNSDSAECEACPAGEVADESGHSCEAATPRALCEAGGWIYENIAAEPDDPAKEVCRLPLRNHSTGAEWNECVARLGKDAELAADELRCKTAFPQWPSSGFPARQTGTTVTFVFSCPSDAPLHSSREYCRGHSGHCAAQGGTETGGNCAGTFPDTPCALGAECVAPLDFRETCEQHGGTVSASSPHSQCEGLPNGNCDYGDDCDAEFARLLAGDDDECAENYETENGRCVPSTAAEVERLRELCRSAGWRRVNYGDETDRYDACSLPLRDAISGETPGEYVVRGERLSYCVTNRDIDLRGGDIPCETVFPDWRTAGFPQSEGDDDERVFIYNCPGGLSSDATRQYCPGSDADCEARGWTAENGECSGAFPASPCETGAGLACLTNFAAGEKCESVGGTPTPTHCLGVGGVGCAFGADCDAAYENHELGCPRNRRLAEQRCVLATDREVLPCRAQGGSLGAEWDAEAEDWVALCVFPPSPFGGARATCRLSDCDAAYAAYAAAPTCPEGQALQTGSYVCGCPPGMQEFDLGNGPECLVPFDCSGTGLENDIPNAQNNGCECPSELPYRGFYSDRCVSSCAAEHIAIDGVCSPQCQEDEFRNQNGTCECKRF